eukprot:366390-Chlamydomonas_euryale.AAC.16
METHTLTALLLTRSATRPWPSAWCHSRKAADWRFRGPVLVFCRAYLSPYVSSLRWMPLHEIFPAWLRATRRAAWRGRGPALGTSWTAFTSRQAASYASFNLLLYGFTFASNLKASDGWSADRGTQTHLCKSCAA